MGPKKLPSKSPVSATIVVIVFSWSKTEAILVFLLWCSVDIVIKLWVAYILMKLFNLHGKTLWSVGKTCAVEFLWTGLSGFIFEKMLSLSRVRDWCKQAKSWRICDMFRCTFKPKQQLTKTNKGTHNKDIFRENRVNFVDWYILYFTTSL